MVTSVEDPRFWMLNTEWSDMMLGTSGTIGQYGSQLCSIARMLWAVRDHKSDLYWSPLRLNKWLCEHNGYSRGNEVSWAVLDDLGVVRFAQMTEHPRPVSDIALADLFSWIGAGQQLLIEVNLDPRNRGAKNPHWLHVDRIVQDALSPIPQLLAYDPFYGKIVNVGAGRYVRNHKSLRNAVWREIRYEAVKK